MISSHEMSLRTISVGRPQDVEIGGRTVRTAIQKTAASGSVKVDFDGVAGNKSAVHPDPVYVLSAASVRHWDGLLNTSGASWPDGYLGENFTIEGLDETTVRLGDRFRLGDTVEMTVLGPRVPCDKLAWRLDQNATFLKDFALSGLTGFYMSVDVPGEVSAGDTFTRISSANDAPLARSISDLIWQAEGVTLEDLDAALALDTLSATSRYPLLMKRIRMEEQTRVQLNTWDGWRSFKIGMIRDEAPDVRSFILEPDDGAPVAGYRAGQFLSISEPRLAGAPKTRTYSISDYSHDLSSYRITVKRQGKGTGTEQLFDLWQPGAKLDVRMPAGRFVPNRTALEPVVLVAGGIGITPLLSMAKAMADLGPLIPKVYVFACMRSASTAIFDDELEELCASHPQLTLIRIHSQPDSQEHLGATYDIGGRLTLDHIADALSDSHVVYAGTRIDIPWTMCRFYICGPEGFEAALKHQLLDAGATPDRVLTESFNVDAPSGGIGVETADIVFRKSGLTAKWQQGDFANLLEFAEDLGIDAPSSCRIGSCQSCSAKVLSGQTVYDGTPTALPDTGFALLCCSVPASDTVEIDM